MPRLPWAVAARCKTVVKQMLCVLGLSRKDQPQNWPLASRQPQADPGGVACSQLDQGASVLSNRRPALRAMSRELQRMVAW